MYVGHIFLNCGKDFWSFLVKSGDFVCRMGYVFRCDGPHRGTLRVGKESHQSKFCHVLWKYFTLGSWSQNDCEGPYFRIMVTDLHKVILYGGKWTLFTTLYTRNDGLRKFPCLKFTESSGFLLPVPTLIASLESACHDLLISETSHIVRFVLWPY